MTRRGLFAILIVAPLAKVFPRLFKKPEPSFDEFERLLEETTAPSQIKPDTMVMTPADAKAYLDRFRRTASMSLEDWVKGPPWSPDALKIQRGGAHPRKEKPHV